MNKIEPLATFIVCGENIIDDWSTRSCPVRSLGSISTDKGHPVSFCLPVSLFWSPLPLESRALEPLGPDIKRLASKFNVRSQASERPCSRILFYRFFCFAYFHPSLWPAVVSLLWSLFLVSVHPFISLVSPSITFVPPWVGAFHLFPSSLLFPLPFLSPLPPPYPPFPLLCALHSESSSFPVAFIRLILPLCSIPRFNSFIPLLRHPLTLTLTTSHSTLPLNTAWIALFISNHSHCPRIPDSNEGLEGRLEQEQVEK